MSKVIMVGCDLHDRSMFLKYAVGAQEPLQAVYVNDVRGRLKMILELQDSPKSTNPNGSCSSMKRLV